MAEIKQIALPPDDWKSVVALLRRSGFRDTADAIDAQMLPGELMCPYHLTDVMLALIDFARSCGGVANSKDPTIAAAMSRVIGAVASFAEDHVRVGGLAESATEFASALGERSLAG